MPLTKVDASNIIDGVLPVANGGTGQTTFPSPGTAGNVLTSNGTAWTSVTPVPNNALSSSFPLKSGATLTAGRAVPINSSGEVGDYPVLNTAGTLVSGTTAQYGAVSTDGSRTLIYINQFVASSNPFQVRGSAITSSGTVTGTATNLGSGNTTNLYGYARAINATQFLLVYFTGNDIPNNFNTVTYSARIATVDASGNITLGSAVTWTLTNIWPNGGSNGIIFPLPNGRFAFWGYSIDGSTYVPTYASSTFSISGTTVTRSANATMNFLSNYAANITSSNKLVGIYDRDFYYCNYDGTTTSSFNNTNIASDARANSSAIGLTLNATNAIHFYQKANNDIILNGFSINQSTGAPTLTSTRTITSSTFLLENARMLEVNETDIVILYRLGSVTYLLTVKLNSSAAVVGTGIPLAVDSSANALYDVTATSTSGTVRVFYNTTFGNSRDIVINTYNTPPWVTLGATSTTQNTSPATVVIGGICGGFSGLTPGASYYVNESTYNGQITTTAGSFLIGTATSTTQILLG